MDGRRRKAVSPWEFLAAFLGVFFMFSVFLYIIDFVPEAPGSNTISSSSSELASAATGAYGTFPIEEPTRIAIPAVGINAVINNPTSTNATVLDNALLSGAVRYPDSGLLGDVSRMYIFGHQSYLPIVRNQAYKTFNGLQKLKSGDEVIVYSATHAYQYRVFSVKQETADTGVVSLGGTDRMLTLSTCDSFGTKSDRFVVEAQFIGPIQTP